MAGANPIVDAIFGGLKQVGEAGVDAVKTVAQLPLTIATLPTDFIKQPELFFGDGPKGVDIAAIISKDYRKQKAADIQGARDWERMRQNTAAVKFVHDLFSGQATDTAQGETKKALIARGYDPAMLQPIATAAKAERHAARKGAAASGLLPEVANIADVETSQRAGLSQLSDRFQKEQIGTQGAETRQNQANQFGFTVAAQNNSAANTAANIKLRDRLGKKRLKLADRLKEKRAANGGSASMAALAGNPYGRKLLTDHANRAKTLADLDNMDAFRRQPHLFATGSGITATVESGLENMTGRAPSKFTRDRTALQQATGMFVANYMQSISGATIPDAEVKRLSENVPNLATDSYSTYFTKLDAMRAAATRDQELLRAQMDALAKGDEAGAAGIGELRGKEASALADALEQTGPIPESDLQYLTPEERAELQQ